MGRPAFFDSCAKRRSSSLALRQQAFALGAFAGELAGAANGFSLFAGAFFRRFFEVVAALHLPEETFALHLLLERFQCLIDIVVADDDLNDVTLSNFCSASTP